jgi:hypothetical protein
MVEGFPVKVARSMIPTTPTRKHQNLRPGFCRITRSCLHLDLRNNQGLDVCDQAVPMSDAHGCHDIIIME